MLWSETVAQSEVSEVADGSEVTIRHRYQELLEAEGRAQAAETRHPPRTPTRGRWANSGSRRTRVRLRRRESASDPRSDVVRAHKRVRARCIIYICHFGSETERSGATVDRQLRPGEIHRHDHARTREPGRAVRFHPSDRRPTVGRTRHAVTTDLTESVVTGTGPRELGPRPGRTVVAGTLLELHYPISQIVGTISDEEQFTYMISRVPDADRTRVPSGSPCTG